MSNDAGMSNNARDPKSEGQSGQSENVMELLKQLVDNSKNPAELADIIAAILRQNQGAEQRLDSFGTNAAQIREEVRGNGDELRRVHQVVGQQTADVQADLASLGQQVVVSAASQSQNFTQASQQQGAVNQTILTELNGQVGKLVEQGKKPPPPPTEESIRNEMLGHFGPGGTFGQLIQLDLKQLGYRTTRNWLDLPNKIVEAIRKDADAKFARGTPEHTQAMERAQSLENRYQDMLKSMGEKNVRSSFNFNMLTMGLSNLAVVGYGIALGSAVAAGSMAVAPALLAFSVASIVNVGISLWCKSNISSDFQSTVAATFVAARASSDPVEQLTLVARVAHMVQRWKWRAVIGQNSLRVGSSASLDNLWMAMGQLQTALEVSLKSCYAPQPELIKQAKAHEFKKKLDLFSGIPKEKGGYNAVAQLENRWHLMPELLGTVASVAGFAGLMGGLWAAVELFMVV